MILSICANAYPRPVLVRFLLACVVALALLLPAMPPAWARQPLAAIVVDARTGKVLHARAADAPRYPASITKVMTLYLLFREMKAGRLSPKTRLRISRRAASMQPSKLWLKPGQSITVDQAIRALAVKSANDVAVAVAEHLAGSERAFARRMTQMARALGMTRTTFRNASGLPYPPNVSTARDLATLSLRLMRDFPGYYRKYFSLRYFTWRGRRHRNHNRLLGRVRGMDGIKTGYTRAAGSNLAASVRRGGKRIVAVVLGASSSKARNAYMARLIEDTFRRRRLVSGNRIAALAGMPPGYSAARARALLARLEGSGRRTTARRNAPPAPRPKERPRVKVASISATPHPEASQALARLASAAATMPPAGTRPQKNIAKRSDRAQPPLPRSRPDSSAGVNAGTAHRPAAFGAPSPQRPHAATHDDLLATSVMVRVLEEEAEEEKETPVVSPAVTKPEAATPGHSGNTGQAPRPEPEQHDQIAGEGATAVIHKAAPGAVARAGMASLPLRTQRRNEAQSEVIVITKTSAPPPQEDASHQKRQGPSQIPAGNPGSMRLITDNPQRVRELMATRWLIQIVAAPTLDAAQRFLLKARKASTQLRARPSFVVQVRREGKTYYRARFAGFSRKQAYRACRELKRRGISCMPMAPNAG